MKKIIKKPEELEFISQIKRDGSGTLEVKKTYLKYLLEANDDFECYCLSLTEKTYIAFNFNSFVVRFKS